LRRRRPTVTERERTFARVVASIVIGIAACFGTANFAVAQPTSDSSTLDGNALLDRFLDEVETLQADFEQELWTADERLLETASGSLTLSRPNKFRWRYEEPYEQLVVADANNLWIYDVELDQATVTAMDDTAASSPAMLLSGDRAVREGFTVVEAFEREGLEWIRLRPELEGTDFTSVLIAFDERNAPRRLELVDALQQVTRIAFSNVVVNPKLREDAFELDLPDGVDVIGTPG
jgi:outer membrane lipoprotein carrier protein